MSTSPTVGIVIPTYQAAKHLPNCLPPLLQSSLNPKILIIDSSSNDGTASLTRSMGIETLVIPQNTFNHGTTREMGRKYLNTSIIVMMTQDAYAASPQMLEKLLEPLVQGQSSIAYARQLPHAGSGIFAAFPRSFNYPSGGHIRSLEDAKTYGAYTFFCSNSCAAYLNEALDEIGGFDRTLFGEDTIAAAKLLRRGHRIAYVSNALVHHSHDYSLKQEFKRHFDMGLARQLYRELILQEGQDTQRGKDYTKALFLELIKKSPQKIPYAFVQTLIKFCGYRLGQKSVHAPLWFKKLLSSQKYYWKN